MKKQELPPIRETTEHILQFNIKKSDANATPKPKIKENIKQIDQESEETLLKRAEEYKTQGNEYFSKKKYKEAVEAYTDAIGYNTKNPILPGNRAMSYLKLKKFSLAILDCDMAIKIDPTYVKAYYRRGIARQSLEEYDDAMNDFIKVLDLEPKNAPAKTEISKLEKILENTNKKKKDENSDTKTTPTIKIIEESDKIETTQEKKVTLEKKIETNPVISEQKIEEKILNKPIKLELKLPETVPKTYYEFEKCWNTLKSDSKLLFQFLKMFQNENIEKLLLNSLTANFLTKVFQIFEENLSNVENQEFQENCELVKNFLESISKAKRFSMIIMFFGNEEKKLLNSIFENLESKYGSSELEKLKKQYL